MGNILLGILIAVELGFCVWNIVKRDFHTYEKSIVNIGLLLGLFMLSVTGIVDWSFRYYMLGLVLLIQAALAARKLYLIKRSKRKNSGTADGKQTARIISKSVWRVVGKSILYATALTLAILCPQYKLVPQTGSYTVATAIATITDENRDQPYGAEGKREVNVEFWYPENTGNGETYPLVLFSHGAYGVKLTNESLFRELASHGYVVCSIDHPYHSFFTVNDKKEVTIVSQEYLSQYQEFAATADPNVGYPYIREWMDIRTADMELVLDSILSDENIPGLTEIRGSIDMDTVIAAGHSMGGAAALSLGRSREEIDAVIALEAPYFGDIIGVEQDMFVWTDADYPVPVLNIYSDSSWGSFSDSVTYTQNERMLQEDGTRNVHIEGTRHLGLTDLSLLCPMAVELLDGEKSRRNPHEVLEEINREVLDFLTEEGLENDSAGN